MSRQEGSERDGRGDGEGGAPEHERDAGARERAAGSGARPPPVPRPADPAGDLLKALGAGATLVAGGVAATAVWLRQHVFTDERIDASVKLVGDVVLAGSRVFTRVRVPTVREVGDFVGGELIGNAVGWAAALASAGLVDAWFERRGLGNLFGLARDRDKVLLSAEQYEWLGAVVAFAVGLAVLVTVRFFVVGLLRELRAIREEPVERPVGGPRAGVAVGGHRAGEAERSSSDGEGPPA